MKTCSSSSPFPSLTPTSSISDRAWPRRRLPTTKPIHGVQGINDSHHPASNTPRSTFSSSASSRRSRSGPSTLLVFFILLSVHCLLSSAPSSNGSSSSLLIQPCEAIVSTSNNNNNHHNSNQRVDIPSPNEFPPLIGTDFAYTQQTPLGGLADAREYVDGALATQKLVAAPMIPIDRQMWVGIDTRTAYFGNHFGGDKIEQVPQLLQTGMRRLVIDLWWDGAGLGWQLCPRFKRDGSQLVRVMTTLERDHEDLEEALEIQEMGKNQTAPPTAVDLMQDETAGSSTSAASVGSMYKRDSRYTSSEEQDPSGDNGSGSSKGASRKDDHVTGESRKNPHPPRGRPAGHEWFRKKRPPRRPPIKTHGARQATARPTKDGNKNVPTASAIHGASGRGGLAEASSLHDYHGRLHGLAMSKGKVSSYDKSTATDTTVDGITCSTGEDVVMLLQRLAGWMKDTDDTEFEDVLVIVLNLNELGNQSLGSRPPPQQPTPSPSPVPGAPAINSTGVTPPTRENPSGNSISPNTNKTIKALLPNIISLRELFTDAFPHLIYTPSRLQMERDDLEANWWRTGRVGLDYYNTTTDPATGRIQAPTGWPTSYYLTEVVGRRIVVSIGANRLSANTTYNVTDDFATLYAPGAMGPSMTNSSLLQVSSALNESRCSFPVPGVAMIPTGSEANTPLEDSSKEDGPIVTNVPWSFASMSDGDLSPWSFTSGQLATGCGFSALLEGRAPTLSFSEHTAMTIWSWDLDQPPQNQTRSRDRRCGVMQSNGRWAVQDCNMHLPVACRQINTSGKWLIYDKVMANYRDVTCPPGYQFDVPRTAQENQQLHNTLLQYWNTTVPTFYASLMDRHRREQQAIEMTRVHNPFRELLDKEAVGAATPRVKRQDTHVGDDDNPQNEGQEGSSSFSTSPALSNEHGGQIAPGRGVNGKGDGQTSVIEAKEAIEPVQPLKAVTGVPGGGMIWIDISSWQTAGCWVPGGIHGRCPYQEPDNTVALQEIIKVSTIGGVIILVLAGMFLYLKCRRNVRLSKDNKRRAMVRDKIMETEVETVPA